MKTLSYSLFCLFAISSTLASLYSISHFRAINRDDFCGSCICVDCRRIWKFFAGKIFQIILNWISYSFFSTGCLHSDLIVSYKFYSTFVCHLASQQVTFSLKNKTCANERKNLELNLMYLFMRLIWCFYFSLAFFRWQSLVKWSVLKSVYTAYSEFDSAYFELLLECFFCSVGYCLIKFFVTEKTFFRKWKQQQNRGAAAAAISKIVANKKSLQSSSKSSANNHCKPQI